MVLVELKKMLRMLQDTLSNDVKCICTEVPVRFDPKKAREDKPERGVYVYSPNP